MIRYAYIAHFAFILPCGIKANGSCTHISLFLEAKYDQVDNLLFVGLIHKRQTDDYIN